MASVCTSRIPSERQIGAHDTVQLAGSPQVELVPASAAPLVALAFKLEDGRFGQLTYMRVYPGSLKEGHFIFHGRSGKRIEAPKNIDKIGPGEICTIFGVECASGDAFTRHNYSMVSGLFNSGTYP